MIGIPRPNPSTRNWFDTCDLPSLERQLFFQQIDPPSVFEHPQPTLIDNPEDTLFKWCVSLRTQETFVARLPLGRFWNDPASVLTPDNTLLTDLSPLIPFNTKFDRHPLTRRFHFGKPAEHQGNGLLLSSYFSSDNYYHWIWDLLPRIALWQKSRFAGEKMNWVFVNNIDSSYAKETLKYANIDLESCIATDRIRHLRCEHLFVPSYPSRIGFPPAWAARWLNDLIPDSQNTGYPYIILDRSDARHRRLFFPDAILKALEGRGFQLISLSNQSVVDQATIFRNAKVIISPHGAGLANLCFAKPGTQLIEIFPNGFENCIYWFLTSQTGIGYHPMVASASDTKDHHDIHFDDPQKSSTLLRTIDEMIEGLSNA